MGPCVAADMHPRQLTHAIHKVAAGPDELLALIQQHKQDMTSIHVSAAFSRLGKWCKQDSRPLQDPAVQQLLQLLEPLLQRDLQQFSQWELANAVQACHDLNREQAMQQLLQAFLQPEILQQADTRALRCVLSVDKARSVLSSDDRNHLHELLKPTALSQLAYGVWDAAKRGVWMSDQDMQDRLAALCKQLDRVSPGDISKVLYAAAKLGKQVDEQQLQQLLAALNDAACRLSPQALSGTLWACSQLRVLPLGLLPRCTQDPHHVATLVQAATPKQLAGMAAALGQMSSGDRDQPSKPYAVLGKSLLQQAVSLLQHGATAGGGLTAQHLTALCWMAAMLDLASAAAWVLQLVQACASDGMWETMRTTDLRRLGTVQLWLQDVQRRDTQLPTLNSVLSAHQLAQCRDRVEQHTARTAEEFRRSPGTQCVFEALQQLPADTWQEQPALAQCTADGKFAMHITAVLAGGVPYAVEVEGPEASVRVLDLKSHWNAPPTILHEGRRMDGPTGFRVRALKARGYRVEIVPLWRWEASRQAAGVRDFIQWALLRGQNSKKNGTVMA